ncbi:MAG TPA: hypothetical protein VGR62_23450 [Candidatus Binatia bacterium]|nr:hypothetical protein [Candidatus Binatia bacterium]
MVAFSFGLVQPSQAAVDMGGPWSLSVGVLGSPVPCTLDVVQTGTALTATATGCAFGYSGTQTGTIDPDTGAFTLTADFPPPTCSSLVTNGTVAANSYSFSGTFVCVDGTIVPGGTVLGSRCHNGALEPGEGCDLGACCSDTCQLEAPGVQCSLGECVDEATCDAGGTCNAVRFTRAAQACNPDANACTRDVCDGAGQCTHPPDDHLTCSGTSRCQENARCEAGTCVTDPAPAGTRCDADNQACTLDVCDSGGQCTAGACSPCCDPGAGCSAAPDTCNVPVEPRNKVLLVDPDPFHHRPGAITWTWGRGNQPTFPDPTASDATLCVYYAPGALAPRLLTSATAPGGCPTCWRSNTKGFIYTNKSGLPDGMSSIKLKGSASAATIGVKAKGPNVSFSSTALPLFHPSTVTVQLRAGGQCWSTTYAPPTQKLEGGKKLLRQNGS